MEANNRWWHNFLNSRDCYAPNITHNNDRDDEEKFIVLWEAENLPYRSLHLSDGSTPLFASTVEKWLRDSGGEVEAGQFDIYVNIEWVREGLEWFVTSCVQIFVQSKDTDTQESLQYMHCKEELQGEFEVLRDRLLNFDSLRAWNEVGREWFEGKKPWRTKEPSVWWDKESTGQIISRLLKKGRKPYEAFARTLN